MKHNPIPNIDYQLLTTALKRKCKVEWIAEKTGICKASIGNYSAAGNPTMPSVSNARELWNLAIKELDTKTLDGCIKRGRL